MIVSICLFVVYEGRNAPVASDASRAIREFKRPDFYWAYHDHEGNEPARQFVVECKRLSIPRTADWVFTRRYVADGVMRFIEPDHGYGKEAPSGAMVGYVQDIHCGVAIDEVNGHLQGSVIPMFEPMPAFVDPLRGFEHRFERRFPLSPFKLRHFWRLA